MPTPTTSIGTFIDALVTRLQADATVGAAQVTDGLPWPAQLEREAVVVVGARPGDPIGGGQNAGQRPAALGQRRREERYIVDVLVSVVKPSRETQKDARDRAFALVAGIETSLHAWGSANPPYDGTVRIAQVTGLKLDQPASTDEREASVAVEIACQARI